MEMDPVDNFVPLTATLKKYSGSPQLLRNFLYRRTRPLKELQNRARSLFFLDHRNKMTTMASKQSNQFVRINLIPKSLSVVANTRKLVRASELRQPDFQSFRQNTERGSKKGNRNNKNHFISTIEVEGASISPT